MFDKPYAYAFLRATKINRSNFDIHGCTLLVADELIELDNNINLYHGLKSIVKNYNILIYGNSGRDCLHRFFVNELNIPYGDSRNIIKSVLYWHYGSLTLNDLVRIKERDFIKENISIEEQLKAFKFFYREWSLTHVLAPTWLNAINDYCVFQRLLRSNGEINGNTYKNLKCILEQYPDLRKLPIIHTVAENYRQMANVIEFGE